VEYTPECEAFLLEAMKQPKTVAWGEIGLDYHEFPRYNYAKPPVQKETFISQAKSRKFLQFFF
jgi:TatD DNase family protein